MTRRLVLFVALVIGIELAVAAAGGPRPIDAHTMKVATPLSIDLSPLDSNDPSVANAAQVFTTAEGTGAQRLAQSAHAFNASTPPTGGMWTIALDASELHQPLIGFGGALTDAAAVNIHALSPATQDAVLGAYYGANGIGYTVARVPVAACDFSTHRYTYADTPVGDLTLANFSIAMDKAGGETNKLPFIRRVVALAQSAGVHKDAGPGPYGRAKGMALFASTWSGPAWLKTNDNVIQGSINGTAGGAVHEAYAKYLRLFLDAYAAEGVDFWGMTTQNEPTSTGPPIGQKWQSTVFDAAQERDFIARDLGPELERHGYGPGGPRALALMAHDDQRISLVKRAAAILTGPGNASKYVAGLANHWYGGVEDNPVVTAALGVFKAIATTRAAHPGKFILPTEACNGFLPLDLGPKVGLWKRGELYGHDVLQDLAHGAAGWTDWNIALNLKGGPNWAGNVVDAPILLNVTDAGVANDPDSYFLQPMYFYLAHFARFLAPGAVRVGLDSKAPHFYDAALEAVAFRTPDAKRVVLVVLNRAGAARNYAVTLGGRAGAVSLEVPAHGVQSIVFNVAAKK